MVGRTGDCDAPGEAAGVSARSSRQAASDAACAKAISKMVRMFVVLNSLLLLARGRGTATHERHWGGIAGLAVCWRNVRALLKRVELGTSVETKPHFECVVRQDE